MSVGPASAAARAPGAPAVAQVSDQQRFEITGAPFGVVPVGDFNGDGVGDLVASGTEIGRAPRVVHLIFGRRSAGRVDVRRLGSGGLTLAHSRRTAGVAAGDVNGDGLADLLLKPSFGQGSQTAHVVYGRPGSGAIDVATLGDGGFTITVPGLEDAAGAGDVNGDGLADILVGNPRAASAWLVFGRPGSAPVDVRTLGERGFQIDGDRADSLLGRGLAAAGDVNGDGLGDLALGASGTAKAFVVFGKADTSSVALYTLGGAGYRIDHDDEDGFGEQLADAGDVNGDGRPDLILGALADGELSGSAYVIYGKRDPRPVDTERLGNHGFRVDGAVMSPNPFDDVFGDGLGDTVAPAGDLNADGLADVVIGTVNRRHRTGFVVYGSRVGRNIRIDKLCSRGFQLDGREMLNGDFPTGVGDVFGGRSPDLLATNAIFTPRPTVSVTASRLRASRDGRVQVPLSCPASSRPLRGTLSLTARHVRLARIQIRAVPGRADTVNLRLTQRGRTLLERSRKLHVIASFTSAHAPASITRLLLSL